MDQLPQLVPAIGGGLGLLVVAGWLVISFMRESANQRRERAAELIAVKKERAEEIAALKRDMEAVKAENVTCRWQVNGLVNALREGGIKIPEYLFRTAPDDPA